MKPISAHGNVQAVNKIFFPNLDGLRFISFLLVFFAHSFSTDNVSIKQTLWYGVIKDRIFSDGDIPVSFFFVLSGFLITYLLLKEKDNTGKINVKSFYVRRALRIWPLYYSVLLFGFLIFPLIKKYFGLVPNETANPWLCFTFLNNFDRLKHIPDASVISILWSVAIEEQFYLIWPLLFYFTPRNYYLHVIAIVILISTIFRALFIDTVQIDIHTLGVITDMGVGGLLAYLISYNLPFLAFIKTMPKWLNLFFYIMALLLFIFKQEIFFNDFMIIIKRIIMSAIFAFIIAEQNFSENSFFKLSNCKVVSRLGKYTYGLYCLHSIAILTVTTLLFKLSLYQTSWQIWLLEIPLSLGLSIVISWLSFTYFESRFLKFKNKFAFFNKD